MKVRLFAAPWMTPVLTEEAAEAIDIIGDDIWRDASIQFYATRDAKIRAGRSAPKGMQRYLNEVLNKRFQDNDWEGDSGWNITVYVCI